MAQLNITTKSELIKRIQNDLETLVLINEKQSIYFNRISMFEEDGDIPPDDADMTDSYIESVIINEANIIKLADDLKIYQEVFDEDVNIMNDELCHHDKLDLTKINKEYFDDKI